MLTFILTASAIAYTPSWSGGSGYLSPCARVTSVFKVPICLTRAAWDTCSGNPSKCNHVANVMAQLLDNNEDGVVDDQAVVDLMIAERYFLYVPQNEDEYGDFPMEGKGQLSGLWEATPNSCDVPTNRGATTARSTWAGSRSSTSGCSPNRDATVEEALHLITEAAAQLYPSKWGTSEDYSSQAGAAIQSANGNCGWGYAGNFKDPSTGECAGQYAYDDETCDARCIIVEGIYWAVVSYIGGLYTDERAAGAQNEWLMTTPDEGMPVIPEGVSNAKSLQAGAPALYALVSDTTSPGGHAWLPAIMPNGKYNGPEGGGVSSGGGNVGGGGGCSVGCLIGVISGSVGGLVLICVGIYCYRKKKKQVTHKPAARADTGGTV